MQMSKKKRNKSFSLCHVRSLPGALKQWMLMMVKEVVVISIAVKKERKKKKTKQCRLEKYWSSFVYKTSNDRSCYTGSQWISFCYQETSTPSTMSCSLGYLDAKCRLSDGTWNWSGLTPLISRLFPAWIHASLVLGRISAQITSEEDFYGRYWVICCFSNLVEPLN